jgi:methylene-fatty-acyl-phospholipid synthase
MTWWLLGASACALAVERIAYAAIWRDPGTFHALCAQWPRSRLRDPVKALATLFCVFKAIQGTVFAAWIALHAGTLAVPPGWPWARTLGVLGIAAGQVLNVAVFLRLGRFGVFYGNRFGHPVTWCRAFPFSIVSHPQYVGTVLSIWGLFAVMRYPNGDWYLLPLLETVYYAIGAHAERTDPSCSLAAGQDSGHAATRRRAAAGAVSPHETFGARHRLSATQSGRRGTVNEKT